MDRKGQPCAVLVGGKMNSWLVMFEDGFTAVTSRNDLTPDDVISVLFTVTPDLTAEFPALAARKLGFHAVPLMCSTEIPVPGAMPRVVRLMAHVETDLTRAQIQHVYLRGAVGLRQDIAQ